MKPSSSPRPSTRHLAAHVDQGFSVGAGRLELVIGDITSDDSDAIVNPTGRLGPGLGGMVDLAIQRRGGRRLIELHRETFPNLGAGASLAVTPGFDLPARFVIHVVPPLYDVDRAVASRRLAECYRSAIEAAVGRGLGSLGVPSLATGALGYPVREAAPIAVRAIVDAVGPLPRSFRVRLVLFGPATFDAYLAAARATALWPDAI